MVVIARKARSCMPVSKDKPEVVESKPEDEVWFENPFDKDTLMNLLTQMQVSLTTV